MWPTRAATIWRTSGPGAAPTARDRGQHTGGVDVTKRTCSIDDCGRPVKARGWCNRHYRSWQRHGDPNARVAKGHPDGLPVGDTCVIDDCGAPVTARGWCDSHYRRWLRDGDPLVPLRKTPEGEPMQFLQSVVADPPSDCVIWPYGIGARGYARIQFRGAQTSASRVALELHSGPPEREGMHAAHAPKICHNPLCVNPRHLRWATPAENMADRVLDGTDNRGSRQGASKLIESDVVAIRSDERTHREIADDYGISASSISTIKARKSWGHVE